MNDAPLMEETATPTMAEFVRVIGPTATRKLCEAFGGLDREIGKPAQSIVNAIGLEAALLLRDYWGRGRIYIPRRPVSFEARKAKIVRLRSEGTSVQCIAYAVGLSERQVYSLIAAAKQGPGGAEFTALLEKRKRGAPRRLAAAVEYLGL